MAEPARPALVLTVLLLPIVAALELTLAPRELKLEEER